MKKTGSLVLVVGLLASVQNAASERYSFVGYRAQGMGGAGAATVNDSSAQWQNPAAFGFFNREPDPVEGTVSNAVANGTMGVTSIAVTNAVSDAEPTDNFGTNAAPESTDMDGAMAAMVVPERARVDNANLQQNDWGWNLLGLGVGYTMTDDMPEYVTQLGKIDFDAFDGSGLNGSVEAVESAILIGSALNGLASNPDNAFYIDANAGMNFRFGRWGIGVRGFSEVAGFVDYFDKTNFGIEQSKAQYVNSINSAAASDGFNPGTWTYQTINPGDLTGLAGETGSGDAEKYIDYQLTQLKKDGVITDKNVQDSVEILNAITYGVASTDPASIENNKSTVTARGFGLFEVPLSFGYAFNDNLSIGITAKGMYGTVTGTKVQATNGDSLDAAMDVLEENAEGSFNFGLDLGVLYRMKMLQFAAVAHNINAPKFDGFTDTIDIENDQGQIIDTLQIQVPDYTIDPQVTLGAAFIPSKRFMLEMSYDLLETGTLMENYNIQRLSFGGELDLWLLAFRLGAYNNLAADWQDWVATAGVGLNLWAVRLDVGGAYSIGANAEYEGTEIPEEARLYAALSMEF